MQDVVKMFNTVLEKQMEGNSSDSKAKEDYIRKALQITNTGKQVTKK